jgi:hypothetical protein
LTPSYFSSVSVFWRHSPGYFHVFKSMRFHAFLIATFSVSVTVHSHPL